MDTYALEMMSFYNDEGKLTLDPGEFRLGVGGYSPGQRGQDLGAPRPVTAVFEVKENTTSLQAPIGVKNSPTPRARLLHQAEVLLAMSINH